MGDFMQQTGSALLSGIPVHAWRRFLATFQDNLDESALDRGLRTITSAAARTPGSETDRAMRALRSALDVEFGG